jgi:hypothetical protein
VVLTMRPTFSFVRPSKLSVSAFSFVYAINCVEITGIISVDFHVNQLLIIYKTYSNVCVGKNLPDTFSIQNGLKQGDALSPLQYYFALQYEIRKVQKTLEGSEMNGTRQLLMLKYWAKI